jgi:hypothetical protein
VSHAVLRFFYVKLSLSQVGSSFVCSPAKCVSCVLCRVVLLYIPTSVLMDLFLCRVRPSFVCPMPSVFRLFYVKLSLGQVGSRFVCIPHKWVLFVLCKRVFHVFYAMLCFFYVKLSVVFRDCLL